MKSQFSLLVCVAFCSTVVLTSPAPGNITSILASIKSGNLCRIATANGKSFFAYTTTTLSWSGAGDYCQSLGLKLATLQSQEQRIALMGAYNATKFFGGYWTAGRDAQESRQFTWNGTDNVIPTASYFTTQTHKIEYQTCILYASRPGNDSGLKYELCATTWGALCET